MNCQIDVNGRFALMANPVRTVAFPGDVEPAGAAAADASGQAGRVPDAGGDDGAVRRVRGFSLNEQGCHISSFKCNLFVQTGP